jgi:capsid protein
MLGGNYEAFMRQQLRSIAVGVGLTYEQLTSDLTDVNYSSIRA